MPELPDVEAILKYLKGTSLHKRIDTVKVLNSRIVKGGIRDLKYGLIGHSFQEARRRGKFVIVKTDLPNYLILHFGMTGNLRYFKNERCMPPHTRVLFGFQNSYHLAYISQRMLGGIWLIEYPEQLPTIALMGPEPLDPDFTLEVFQERFKNRSKTIKTLLMDQRFIAGIGNLYADEILFQAGIVPYRKAKDLNIKEGVRLYKKIREVLKEANKVNAEVWRLWHKFIIPHRYSDDICPRCGKDLESMSIGNRTTFFCPQCQK